MRLARVDAALTRAEKTAEALLTRLERETRELDIHGLTLRLLSDVVQVRHLCLSGLGQMANRPEALEATRTLLQKWEIDEKTARLAARLPLSPENRKRLSEGLVERAAFMPDFFLLFLLNPREAQDEDRPLLERYLRKASPRGAVSLLRAWPKGKFLSAPVLEELLSREDEKILVPLLIAMKQRSLQNPPAVYSAGVAARLEALSEHPDAAVRVWARGCARRNCDNIKH
jgi:hypothetical protein